MATRWRSQQCKYTELESFIVSSIIPYFFDDVSNHAVGAVLPDIVFHTEKVIKGLRFRANPSSSEHHWAWVLEEHRKFPVQLIIFFTTAATSPLCGQQNQNLEKGTYAIVHKVPEDPWVGRRRQQDVYGDTGVDYRLNANSELLRWSCKLTRALIEGHKTIRGNNIRPILYVIPIEHVTGPCAAIPDTAKGFANCFIFIKPRQEWAALFERELSKRPMVTASASGEECEAPSVPESRSGGESRPDGGLSEVSSDAESGTGSEISSE